MSHIPAVIWEAVLPRLLTIGWIELCETVAPSCGGVAPSCGLPEQKGTEQKGIEQKGIELSPPPPSHGAHPAFKILRDQPNLRGITLEQFLRLKQDYTSCGDFTALCQKVADDAAMMTEIKNPGVYAVSRMKFHTTPKTERINPYAKPKRTVKFA
jgi:hypothetical protein